MCNAALCLWVDRHAASTTCYDIGLRPHISSVNCLIPSWWNTRHILRLCEVFSVPVTWWQLPRYGPSSPKRLEQQGRQFCEPACKKTWGEVKCISLLSIRQPLPPKIRRNSLKRRSFLRPWYCIVIVSYREKTLISYRYRIESKKSLSPRGGWDLWPGSSSV